MENLDLIRKIAWSYVRTCPGLEFDDLLSEACIAFLENGHRYDSSRGARSTFIWRVVSNHLNTIIKKESARINSEIPADEEGMKTLLSTETDTNYPDADQELLARERWAEIQDMLSIEAFTICEFTLLYDKEYGLPVETPKICRGIIQRALNGMGWRWPDIWNALRELKSIFDNEKNTLNC